MLVPVKCITCGYPVGSVEDLFHIMRAKKVKAILEERGTQATQAAVDVGLQIDCSDILDKLHITHECCRKTLVTAMIFTDSH